MKRLFIAINLPPEAKNAIDAEISETRLPEGGRWAEPENWHFTVSFLGDQPEEKINSIEEAMAETAAEFPAFSADLEKIVCEQGRMIWAVGSRNTSETIGRIKESLENKLKLKGIEFEKERRGYNAHITLARLKFPPRNTDVFRGEGLGISFSIEGMDLMKSELRPEGAEYESLARVDFKKII